MRLTDLIADDNQRYTTYDVGLLSWVIYYCDALDLCGRNKMSLCVRVRYRVHVCQIHGNNEIKSNFTASQQTQEFPLTVPAQDAMSLRLLHTLGAEDGERVWHAAWSRDGHFLATCGEDKIIRIYTTANGDWGTGARNIHMVATLEDGQSRTIRHCDWSPNGKCIAAASFDGDHPVSLHRLYIP